MIINLIRKMPANVKLRVLTRADSNSDVKALEKMIKWGEVKALRKFHAKIFIFDDSKVILSSANLDTYKNMEIGVLFVGKSKLVKRLNNIFEELWKKGKAINNAKVKELRERWKRRRTVEREPAIAFGKIVSIEEKMEEFEQPLKQLIFNINWNPHKYEKPCTKREATNNVCCHRRRECLKPEEEWWRGSGCTSSNLFKDFEYATTKNAIVKDRLAFFIAKNPNLGGKYYFVGFLYLTGRRLDGAWSRRLVCFEGDEKKSIRFPSSGKKIMKVSKDFIEKLGSLRGNPKYISSEDAIAILRRYYRKTRDKSAKTILKENFMEKI